MNVLKSFVNPLLSYLFSASLVFASSEVFADTTAQSTSGPGFEKLMSMLLALVLVVAVIVAIAVLAKKFNLTPVGGSHFKLISSMSLGGRERIVIIEIQGRQHAIGVTNHSVNHLFELESNIEPTAAPFADGNLLKKLNKSLGMNQADKTSKE